MRSNCLQDREVEKPRLASVLKQTRNAVSSYCLIPRAAAVYSVSGAGKTALIEAVSDDLDIDLISVKTKAPLRVGIYPPGYYFEQIHIAFDQHFWDYEFKLRKSISPSISAGISAPVPTATLAFGLSEVPKSADQIRRLQLESMIAFCERRRIRPSFHFERCDSIDPESFDLMLYLLDQIGGPYCIFEYSIPAENDIAGFVEFKSKISESIELRESLSLHPLSLEDAITAISHLVSTEDIPPSRLNELYESSGGNLRVFLELCKGAIEKLGDHSFPDNMPSREDCDYILALIALTQRCTSSSELMDICSTSSLIHIDSSIIAICKNLKESGRIIESEENRIQLSFSEDVTAILSTPPAYAAYGTYTSYIRHNRAIEDLSAQQLLDLLNAQCRFLDLSLFDTLDAAKSIICASELSEPFFSLSLDVVRRLSKLMGKESQNTRKAVLTLFSIFYTAADYEHASGFLTEVDTDNQYPFCRFAVDTVFPSSRHVAKRAEELVSQYKSNTRLVLFVQMNMMSYLMRTATPEDCLAYADSILANERALSFPEYWWIKKQRSHFLTLQEATSELCVVSNELHKMDSRMADRVDITYATKLARSGKYSKALELLSSGLDRCSESYCRPGVYYNNIAACHLTKGDYSEDDLRLLRRALTYPLTPFEKQYVAGNALTLCLFLNREEEADSFAKKIEIGFGQSYSYEPYNRLRLSCLSNYHQWKNTAAKCPSKTDSFYEYLKNTGYEPGFIGYWQTAFEQEYIDDLL